jgi:ankyrin repeat domain-containing protein 50
VQMLMDAGADVHAQGGRYSNALQAASERGHDKVVQMLIDAGAVEREHRIEDSESDSSA